VEFFYASDVSLKTRVGDGLCDLCEKLNTDNQEKGYHNLTGWFVTKSKCERYHRTIKSFDNLLFTLFNGQSPLRILNSKSSKPMPISHVTFLAT